MSTVQISAADVNKLRQQTGAGMMDCKKALVEANGDFEAAVDLLRKKGQKVSAARSGNATSEGLVSIALSADGTNGKLVALACETEPVSKVEDFRNLAQAVLAAAVANNPATAEELSAIALEDGRTVAETITELTGKIGEKIVIQEYVNISGEKIVSYIHSNGKMGVLVVFEGANGADITEAGKDVAMQIAAMNPVAVDKDGVDPATIEREIEIAKDVIRQEGKPEEMVEKIAAGKLNKFYKDSTLLNQEFVKDSSVDVRKFLDNTSKGLTVTAFKRVQLGA
ncbi:translation elongation factor Ts [Pedobacter rhizosphaerae]|uniref:Elongation factor Ts n=1 Tax=Pedobacter rhizosphaerae TaxID=390241 RepID=A0A1H9V7E9_9SPHI|nr:translation elongation factor Ts [Pedobacter rhizosphaerae]SES17508.1 translation elongation factor Ts (EF-Ts) [Pedobacter rhizosphaerae]